MARPENMELTIKDSLNDKNQKTSEEKSNKKKKNNTAKKLEPKLHEQPVQPQQQQQPQDHQKRPKNNQKLQKDSAIVPPDVDDERQQKQKEKLQKIIDDFVKDGSKKELHCSSELTSYERMVLHELANIAQLSHASEGEGKIRHIVLRKNSFHVSNSIGSDVKKLGRQATQHCTTEAIEILYFDLKREFFFIV